MPTHADVNATTYRMGAEEALVLLRFRCATIKYKHPVPFARCAPLHPTPILAASDVARPTACGGRCRARRILDGDADPLADILVYVVSRFSEPIAEVLRAHDLYPPPRWSSGASERPREVLEHALLCLDVVAPEANAWIGPADFVRTADQVPQRLKFVLQFIKHFVTRHNAVVASNKAILQQDAVSRPRRTQPNPNSSSDLESLSDSATLPASSPTEHGFVAYRPPHSPHRRRPRTSAVPTCTYNARMMM